MFISETSTIANLKILTPDVFYDFRGEYFETFSKETYRFVDDNGNPIEFVEDDVSISRRNVLRGLHGDAKTWKLVQCLLGEIYLVVVDMRPKSATSPKWESFAINEKNRKQILIPAGCANGHLCLSEKCIFSYKQSQLYSGSHNQFTVRWNDPKIGVWWPITEPILSVRDGSAPLL